MEPTTKPSVWLVLTAMLTIVGPFLVLCVLLWIAEWRDERTASRSQIPRHTRRYE
jgi:hypothetical protein